MEFDLFKRLFYFKPTLNRLWKIPIKVEEQALSSCLQRIKKNFGFR